MEVLDHLEVGLVGVVGLLKFVLEAISVFCVLCGLLLSLYSAVKLTRRSRSFPFVAIRLQFGTWLALALEFQLGADILATTITPSFRVLGQLGAIALIRTFLNYFLTKELEAEQEIQKQISKFS